MVIDEQIYKMEKRHLYIYFKYLVDNKKSLSNLTYFQIQFMFNLISILDENYCSPNLLFKSSSVNFLAFKCQTHPIKIIELLKKISEKGFLIQCYPQFGYYYTLPIRKISKYYYNRLKRDKSFSHIVHNSEIIHDLLLDIRLD